MKKTLVSILMVCLTFVSCKKEDTDDSSSTPAITPAKSFENLTFDLSHAFFSTDGSMSSPIDSNAAKLVSSKIDISYIVNFDYSKDGFLDPRARSQHWYWDGYYASWLSNSVETRFYTTSLTKADFDAAKADQSKIGTYFSGSSVVMAPHSIFPVGSCLGGRQDFDPTAPSVVLEIAAVYGFKNTVSGKRGLMFMRYDQVTAWPAPIISNATKADIIREN